MEQLEQLQLRLERGEITQCTYNILVELTRAVDPHLDWR